MAGSSTYQSKFVDLCIKSLHLPGGCGRPLLCLKIIAQPLELDLPSWIPAVVNLIHTYKAGE